MTQKIKQCECGNLDLEVVKTGDNFAVLCPICYRRGGFSMDQGGAIFAWNKTPVRDALLSNIRNLSKKLLEAEGRLEDREIMRMIDGYRRINYQEMVNEEQESEIAKLRAELAEANAEIARLQHTINMSFGG